MTNDKSKENRVSVKDIHLLSQNSQNIQSEFHENLSRGQ